MVISRTKGIKKVMVSNNRIDFDGNNIIILGNNGIFLKKRKFIRL